MNDIARSHFTQSLLLLCIVHGLSDPMLEYWSLSLNGGFECDKRELEFEMEKMYDDDVQ